jgi:hypothetical protein
MIAETQNGARATCSYIFKKRYMDLKIHYPFSVSMVLFAGERDNYCSHTKNNYFYLYFFMVVIKHITSIMLIT